MQGDDTFDCRQFDEAAWLLISGELDDDARRGWQRHVAGCGACAGVLAERRRVLDIYDGMASTPERGLAASLPVSTRRNHPSLQLALAIAAGLVLLIAGALGDRVLLKREAATPCAMSSAGSKTWNFSSPPLGSINRPPRSACRQSLPALRSFIGIRGSSIRCSTRSQRIRRPMYGWRRSRLSTRSRTPREYRSDSRRSSRRNPLRCCASRSSSWPRIVAWSRPFVPSNTSPRNPVIRPSENVRGGRSPS